MKIARFPAMSSWFRDALFAEVEPADIATAEPVDAVLTGVAARRSGPYTAWVKRGNVETHAEQLTAADAYRVARERFLALESAA